MPPQRFRQEFIGSWGTDAAVRRFVTDDVGGKLGGMAINSLWLRSRFPEADIHHPEFCERFGQLTREELLLAAIEHRRLICADERSPPQRTVEPRATI